MAAETAQTASAAPAPQEPGIYRAVKIGERLFQGEIVEKVVEWVPSYAGGVPDTVSTVSPMYYELAVILTQDCDLAQDWIKRNPAAHIETDLRCVLLCPVLIADSAFKSDERFKSSEGRRQIQQNKNQRYQYLAEIPTTADGAAQGHQALLVDFKSLFTIRTIELYRQLRDRDNPRRRRFRLETPWAEHLQSRFATFHARIGLPRDHFVPEARRV